MAEGIGGFWASLKLKSDKDSFEKGKKQLDQTKEAVKGLSSFILKTAASTWAFVGITSHFQRQQAMMAYTLHMSSQELMAWEGAASMAGVSGNELARSMMTLESKVNRVKLGEVDVGMMRSLGMLGVNYSKFANQNGSDRLRTVMNKAMGMGDKEKAGELVRDTLGDAGKELFEYLKLSGDSIDHILNQAKLMVFTNDQSKKNAMVFDQNLKQTLSGFKEMGNLFGSELAVGLTPLVKEINGLIIANKGLIKENIIKFAKSLTTVAKGVFGILKLGVPIVKGIVGALGGMDNIIRRVAVGMAAFAGAKMIFGLMNIVKSMGGIMKMVNTLKAMSLANMPILLAFTALYLILDDLYAYSTGGHSLTGMFIDWLKDLSKNIDPKTLKELGDIGKFFTDLGNVSLQALGDTLHAIGVSMKWILDLISEAKKGKGDEFLDKSIKSGAKGIWDNAGKQMPKLQSGGDKLMKGDVSGYVKDTMSMLDDVPIMGRFSKWMGSFFGEGSDTKEIKMVVTDKTGHNLNFTVTQDQIKSSDKKGQQAR